MMVELQKQPGCCGWSGWMDGRLGCSGGAQVNERTTLPLACHLGIMSDAGVIVPWELGGHITLSPATIGEAELLLLICTSALLH